LKETLASSTQTPPINIGLDVGSTNRLKEDIRETPSQIGK